MGDPFKPLRYLNLYKLQSDPFEEAEHESMGCGLWRAERMLVLVPAQANVAQCFEIFREFPTRKKAGKILYRSGSGDAPVRRTRRWQGDVEHATGLCLAPPLSQTNAVLDNMS